MTALVVAALAAIFVETAYPAVRGYLHTALFAQEVEASGDYNDPALAALARERWDRLMSEGQEQIDPGLLDQFTSAYADLLVWESLFYLGTPIQKYPTDLIMLHQILMEVRPDYIVETGTHLGGSALFFAHVLEGLGLEDSRVITVDLHKKIDDASAHPLWRQYVEFYHGSSTDPGIVAEIQRKVEGKKTLVTLDSNHRAKHVYRELELYSPLVSAGSYLIVEDTLIDGIPLDPEFGPGPMTALNRFLASGGDQTFEQDRRRDALLLTQNRGGWLRRKAD